MSTISCRLILEVHSSNSGFKWGNYKLHRWEKSFPNTSVGAWRGKVSPMEVLQLWRERYSAVGSQGVTQSHTAQHALKRVIGKDTRRWLPLFGRKAAENWAGDRLCIEFLGWGGAFQDGDWWDFKSWARASSGIGRMSSPGIESTSGFLLCRSELSHSVQKGWSAQYERLECSVGRAWWLEVLRDGACLLGCLKGLTPPSITN